MNPNLLALLATQSPVFRQSGIGLGGMPQFSGMQGADQNLLALLIGSGQMPKHVGLNGEFILPNFSSSGSAITDFQNSPSALDWVKKKTTVPGSVFGGPTNKSLRTGTIAGLPFNML